MNFESTKSVVEKTEQPLSAEELTEAIEQAKALYAELRAYDNVEIVGPDAIPTKHEVEALAAEIKELLRFIPAADCLENGLPYHPTDEKVAASRTPFPESPDYPLSYSPSPSEDHARVDQEQIS